MKVFRFDVVFHVPCTPGLVASICFLAWLVACTGSVTPAHAADRDGFDLASISLQPGYISPALLRESSCLRAVAVAPQGGVVIAVGEAGTILRSENGGDAWRIVDNMHREASIENPTFGRPNRRSDDLVPLPFATFTDVLWASSRDVVVVGGGYEPVTGISRGVCLLSQDAGQTWHLADAHELPRLRSVRIGTRSAATSDSPWNAPRDQRHELAPGVLQAIGDAAEASGVNRFFSHDGGQTWVEDIKLGVRSQANRDVSERATAPSSQSVTDATTPRPPTIETASGAVAVEAVDRDDAAAQFAVGSHGRIWRRGDHPSIWQPVRGADRGTAVLFVAASPATIPWSLAGRESLHENRRTAILVNVDSDSTLHRCRAAAAMMGISALDAMTPTLRCSDWLSQHRPAVVVLDESLTAAARHEWMNAIDQSRTRPFSSATQPRGGNWDATWSGPQRVVLTRELLSPAARQTSPLDDPRWQRAWFHTSTLNGNALLSGPGALANDLLIDALMLSVPGVVRSSGIEVATLEDTSGTVRRDISLAAGLTLQPGQNRTAEESSTASHRRLQVTTARVSQTMRLHSELLGDARSPATPRDTLALTNQLEQLLATTAPDDRTRLLWETLGKLTTSEQPAPSTELVLLKCLQRHGQPMAVRRWASVVIRSIETSVERQWMTDPRSVTQAWRTTMQPVDQLASADSQTSAPESVPRRIEGSQPLSPFQIAPVSYETSYVSSGPPAPQIMVPQTQPTMWQPTRGLTQLPSSPTFHDRDTASDVDALPATARINWDYHRVVMAARGVAPVKTASSSVAARQSEQEHSEERSERAAPYAPPRTHDRPLLDGHVDDACWRAADVLRHDQVQASCVADDEYYYFAVIADGSSKVCLSLDCDGDYFSCVQFEVSSDGGRRTHVDGTQTDRPLWYSAVVPPPLATTAPSRLVVELAVARASLPGSVCRVRVSTPATVANWTVMPDPEQWHPVGR